MSLSAISLWQPWASCIAVGAKRYETRDWSTGYRGLIAIHAAKRYTSDERESAAVFARALGVPLPEVMPLGAVVAIAELVGVHRMTRELIDAQTVLERSLGAWFEDRYAWELADVQPLREPLPMRGRQGLWVLGRDEAALVLERVGS